VSLHGNVPGDGYLWGIDCLVGFYLEAVLEVGLEPRHRVKVLDGFIDLVFYELPVPKKTARQMGG
jgi:hypothetical protein